MASDFEREAMILSEFDHPNIVKLYGVRRIFKSFCHALFPGAHPPRIVPLSFCQHFIELFFFATKENNKKLLAGVCRGKANVPPL